MGGEKEEVQETVPYPSAGPPLCCWMLRLLDVCPAGCLSLKSLAMVCERSKNYRSFEWVLEVYFGLAGRVVV